MDLGQLANCFAMADLKNQFADIAIETHLIIPQIGRATISCTTDAENLNYPVNS